MAKTLWYCALGDGEDAMANCIAMNPNLDFCCDNDLIATGHVGGALRLWADGGVAAGQTEGREPITALAWSHLHSHRLFVAHGSGVSELDLRQLSLTSPVAHHSLQLSGDDELNSLSLAPSDSLLLSADDSGSVTSFDVNGVLQSHCGSSSILGSHDNIASCVSFLPNQCDMAVSCGLDMKVILWNTRRRKRLWSVDLSGSKGGQSTDPCVNPPLCHALSTSQHGSLFAVGAGDGTARVFSMTQKGAKENVTMRCHTSATTQVCLCPKRIRPLLYTGGDDGQLHLWDVSGEEGKDHSRSSRHHRRQRKCHTVQKDNSGSRCLVSIDHGQKLNGLVTGMMAGQQVMLTIDCANLMSAYPSALRLGEG
uniref:WD repeat-containing protein 53 n=1 Tax=Myxine glutinosa TaxID=7769 RepID=UPI00358F4FDA